MEGEALINLKQKKSEHIELNQENKDVHGIDVPVETCDDFSSLLQPHHDYSREGSLEFSDK